MTSFADSLGSHVGAPVAPAAPISAPVSAPQTGQVASGPPPGALPSLAAPVSESAGLAAVGAGDKRARAGQAKVQGNINNAASLERSAAVNTTQNGLDEALLENPVYQAQAKAGENFFKANQEIQAKSAELMGVASAKYQSSVDLAAKAQIHNYWDDKSTTSRIFGVIAAALSGAANGLSGHPDALTVVDRLVQEDMQRQMANLQQANQNVANNRGILKDLVDQTGSLMAGQTALYTSSLAKTKDVINSIAAKMNTSDPAVQARLQMLLAGIETKTATANQALASLNQQNITAMVGEAVGIHKLEDQLHMATVAAQQKAGEKASKVDAAWTEKQSHLERVKDLILKAKAGVKLDAGDLEDITQQISLVSNSGMRPPNASQNATSHVEVLGPLGDSKNDILRGMSRWYQTGKATKSDIADLEKIQKRLEALQRDRKANPNLIQDDTSQPAQQE